MTKAYFSKEGALRSQPPWGALLGASVPAAGTSLWHSTPPPPWTGLIHHSQQLEAGWDQIRHLTRPTGATEEGGGQDRLSLLSSFSSRPSQGAPRAPRDPLQSKPGPLPFPRSHRLGEPGCPEA